MIFSISEVESVFNGLVDGMFKLRVFRFPMPEEPSNFVENETNLALLSYVPFSASRSTYVVQP